MQKLEPRLLKWGAIIIVSWAISLIIIRPNDDGNLLVRVVLVSIIAVIMWVILSVAGKYLKER